MDFLIAGKNRLETGFLRNYKSIDLEIGGRNDFELVFLKDEPLAGHINFGTYIFVPGTEYGGLIEDLEMSEMCIRDRLKSIKNVINACFIFVFLIQGSTTRKYMGRLQS